MLKQAINREIVERKKRRACKVDSVSKGVLEILQGEHGYLIFTITYHYERQYNRANAHS